LREPALGWSAGFSGGVSTDGKNNMIHRILVAGLMLAGLSSTVLASNGRNPGSLLLFPEFDNRMGMTSIVAVTNVDTDQVADLHIDVEFAYIGRRESGLDCEEFNRTERLSAADTFAAFTDVHHPDPEQGYLVCFAKDINTGRPINHNYLTGNIITLDGYVQFEYSINPVSYRADGDPNFGPGGELLLNGAADGYSTTPQQLVIPRFLGQGGNRVSEMILIGLTGPELPSGAMAGGAHVDTTVDLLVWNDNEQVFSSEYTFRCWARVELLNISSLFGNDFLANYTDDDPDEIQGHSSIESGWIHAEGALWNSISQWGLDPAVYVVLVETVENQSTQNSLGMGDLPFEMGIGLTNGVVNTVQL
jgi:hypothetical protein